MNKTTPATEPATRKQIEISLASNPHMLMALTKVLRCEMVGVILGVEVGAFAIIGGSGGSVTSTSVKIWFGAWARGKNRGLITFKRPPG